MILLKDTKNTTIKIVNETVLNSELTLLSIWSCLLLNSLVILTPISKENLPSFKRILVTDDGRYISNKGLNYAVSLSNSNGAELLLLRILEDI